MADTNIGGLAGAPHNGTAKRASKSGTPQTRMARRSRILLGHSRALGSTRSHFSHGWPSSHFTSDHSQRHPVRVAHGLPMEDVAARIRFGVCGPCTFPNLGAPRRIRPDLEIVPERVRRSPGHRLEVAGRRQRHRIRASKRGDCIGKNPTDRAKLGTKRHLHVDRRGIPLAVTLSGANEHDKTQLRTVLDARVIQRPACRTCKQHLCLDKGYDYPDIRLSVRRRGYCGHIPRRGTNQPAKPKHPSRRWVVERTNRWHNLFRRLKIRYEVHAQNYLGFVQLACAIICFRRARDRF